MKLKRRPGHPAPPPPLPVDPRPVPAPEVVEYYTAAEVAALLRVHLRTVHRWCDSGQLPCVRVGETRRIPRTALSC